MWQNLSLKLDDWLGDGIGVCIELIANNNNNNLHLGVFHPKVAFTTQRHINPRTDGGPGHLSTDGGGADNRPPEISKTKQARDKR